MTPQEAVEIAEDILNLDPRQQEALNLLCDIAEEHAFGKSEDDS